MGTNEGSALMVEGSKKKEWDAGRRLEEIVSESLGEAGRWQYTILALMGCVMTTLVWSLLAIVFIGPPIDFHCVGSSNQTCTDSQGEECTSWIYDSSVFSETIASKWDLVCRKRQLVNVTQTSFLFGVMLGSIFISMISDRFGRKRPLIWCGLIRWACGTAAIYSPWYSLFLGLRFFEALSVGGSISITQVICVEVLGAKQRSRFMTLTHLSIYLGTSLASLIAYLTRHWQTYLLTTTLPSVLTISFIWLVPESPRWLVAVGHYEEALAVLQSAAKTNGNPIPKSMPEQQKPEVGEEKTKSAGLVDLLRKPNMRKKTIIIWINFISVGYCFYGIEQYLTHIGGNIFINVAASGACAMPGVLLAILLMTRFGRKVSQTVGQLTISAASFAILLFPGVNEEWERVGLAVVGVMGTGITMPTAYLFASELFPTLGRNTGVGTASVFCRLGAMLSPFAVSLNSTAVYIPPLLFGGISLLAGVLTFFQPETRNTQLPVTFEDAEAFTGCSPSKGKHELADQPANNIHSTLS